MRDAHAFVTPRLLDAVRAADRLDAREREALVEHVLDRERVDPAEYLSAAAAARSLGVGAAVFDRLVGAGEILAAGQDETGGRRRRVFLRRDVDELAARRREEGKSKPPAYPPVPDLDVRAFGEADYLRAAERALPLSLLTSEVRAAIAAEEAAVRAAVDAALAPLDRALRLTAELRLRGLGYRKIAGLLGRSETRVRAYEGLARRRLRKALRPILRRALPEEHWPAGWSRPSAAPGETPGPAPGGPVE